MKKPIIGLVTKHREQKDRRNLSYVCDEMKDALIYNGAIPIGIIPSSREIKLVSAENEQEVFKNLDSLLTENEQEILKAQINLCDGIILSGGIESDAYELWVANYCYKNDIPIIGICAGHNNIVRGIGGTTKKVAKPEIHSQPDQEYVHSVNLEKNSLIYEMVGEENFRVNSRHKNTINDPSFLIVTARDEDGNIEVTEAKEKTCYLGMRFHPESLYLNDEKHNNIFKKFVEICTNKN